MKKGILYGLGVGPGDPEFLTIKSVKILEKVPIICSPRSSENRPSVALSIVRSVLDQRKKSYEIIEPLFPMIEDPHTLNRHWEQAAQQVSGKLEQGHDAAFVTIGDPTLFSTFSYLEEKIADKGFETRIIPGVTSFTGCAAAAHLPLGVKDEIIVVIPKVDDRLPQIIEHADTAIIMKTSRHERKLEEIIHADPRRKDIISVENCGMENERVITGFSKDKYLSTTIIKFK